MTIRPRTWLSALVITAMGVAGFAAPSGANVPQRDTGTLDCALDGSGHASVNFDPTLNGTVAFEATGPGDPKVTALTGDEAEVIDGANEFTTTGFAKTTVGSGLTIEVDGAPNTACVLTFGVDETPSNDEVTAAELITGVAGSVDGSTRAATLSLPDEPQPMPDANRVVWYRWTAPTTTKMRFEIEPKSGTTSFTDPGTIWTSLCLAMYDPAVNLFTPLIVGGVPTADGQSAHGVLFDMDVTAGTQYTFAACSGGGTGQWTSTFEYTAPGAFTLSWNRASAPNPQDDLALTDVDTAKTLDVLHNDTDPDGDTLSVSAFDATSAHGTIARDANDANQLVYAPASGYTGEDSFAYTASDGTSTRSAHVRLWVGVPPQQPLLQANPFGIDFGTVPLGKTKDVDITFTNTSAGDLGPFDWIVTQSQPEPFDASGANQCLTAVLHPGDSCSGSVRFWSVTGADAASPGLLQLIDHGTLQGVGLVQLTGATGPAVPPPPNSNPVANDDLTFAVSGVTHTLEPLDNDSDPDHDIITITNATTPAHGTASIVRCRDFSGGPLTSPQATCLRYSAPAGFHGVDTITYTISDGRGGTDTGVYYIATEQAAPTISSLSPNHGPAGGGQNVAVHGTNFTPLSTVALVCNGVRTTYSGTTISSTEIDFTPGALPPGPCNVEVHYVGNIGVGTLANGYTVDGGTMPTIVPGAASVTEGNSGTKTLNIPVTLSAASSQTVTAHWNTALVNAGNEHEAAPGADYVAASGTVTFAPGQTTATIPVTVSGDVLDEYDELFLVAFSNPTNATIGGFYGLGIGQITDDDAMPTIVPDFGAPSVAEGSSDSVVSLNVSLSAPSGRTVTAHFTMPFAGGNGVATPNTDYVVASGDITFAPGVTHATVPITIHGDTVPEADELVGVLFTNPTNAVMGGVYGIGAIRVLNDD